MKLLFLSRSVNGRLLHFLPAKQQNRRTSNRRMSRKDALSGHTAFGIRRSSFVNLLFTPAFTAARS